MTLSPTGAITDGAQWQVDGGTWQTNGGVIGNLSAGNHTVSFKTIKGWRAPDNEIISVGTNFITPVAAASYSALPGGPSKPIFQVMHSFPGGQQPTQLSAFGPTSPLIYISNMLYGRMAPGLQTFIRSLMEARRPASFNLAPFCMATQVARYLR